MILTGLLKMGQRRCLVCLSGDVENAASEQRCGQTESRIIDLSNAERMRALMGELFGAARIVPAPDRELWCVLVGATSTLADAEPLAAVRREARPIIAVCHGLNAGGVS
jgi:hypothetical protein